MMSLFIYKPMLEELKMSLRLSTYIIKRYGESIPPCLTPLVTVKRGEVTRPHLTQNVCCLYQYPAIRTINMGIPLAISLFMVLSYSASQDASPDGIFGTGLSFDTL